MAKLVELVTVSVTLSLMGLGVSVLVKLAVNPAVAPTSMSPSSPTLSTPERSA